MSRGIKVLLLNGSPRRYGGCYKLLLACIRGVVDAGGDYEVIHLYEHNIKPCIGCVSDDQRVCRFPCIIDDDDFNMIGDKLLKSNGFIIVSPIYWYGVSGVLKNFIDRLTSMENMVIHKGYSLLDGKVAGFITVGDDTGAIETIAYLMSVFNSMGVHIPPWSLAYHHSKMDVLENKDALLDAYNVGYNVVVAAEKLMGKIEWYRTNVDLDEMIEWIKRKTAIEYKKQYPYRAKTLYKEGI